MQATQKKTKMGGYRPGAGRKPTGIYGPDAKTYHFRVAPALWERVTALKKAGESDHALTSRLLQKALDLVEGGVPASLRPESERNAFKVAGWVQLPDNYSQALEQQRMGGESDRELIERLLFLAVKRSRRPRASSEV